MPPRWLPRVCMWGAMLCVVLLFSVWNRPPGAATLTQAWWLYLRYVLGLSGLFVLLSLTGTQMVSNRWVMGASMVGFTHAYMTAHQWLEPYLGIEDAAFNTLGMVWFTYLLRPAIWAVTLISCSRLHRQWHPMSHPLEPPL